MDTKLSAEDARVVDMLLDHGNPQDRNGHQIFTRSPETFHRRLQRVERLLKLLDKAPAGDPPLNLVSRTLDYIEQAEAQHQPPAAGTPMHQGPRPNA